MAQEAATAVLELLRDLWETQTDKYDVEPVMELEALQVLDALDGFILDQCRALGIPTVL